MYQKAHEAIRADPGKAAKKPVEKKSADAKPAPRFGKRKLSLPERQNRVKQRKQAFVKQLQDADDE